MCQFLICKMGISGNVGTKNMHEDFVWFKMSNMNIANFSCK